MAGFDADGMHSGMFFVTIRFSIRLFFSEFLSHKSNDFDKVYIMNDYANVVFALLIQIIPLQYLHGMHISIACQYIFEMLCFVDLQYLSTADIFQRRNVK